MISSQIRRRMLFNLASLFLVHVSAAASLAAGPWTLDSPSSRLHVKIEQRDGIWYSVSLGDTPLIAPSQIDLKVDGTGWLAQQPGEPKVTQQSKTETVKFPVPRKYRQRETKYNELTLEFTGGARLVFRAYDEGVAYRWETTFPNEITVDDEQAQFIFTGEPHAGSRKKKVSSATKSGCTNTNRSLRIGSDRFCSTGVLIDLPAGHKLFISESDLRLLSRHVSPRRRQQPSRPRRQIRRLPSRNRGQRTTATFPSPRPLPISPKPTARAPSPGA